MNLKKEKYYWQKGYKIIVGLDEVGRGPLAGPITAAAVIINPRTKNIYSTKTKKLKIKDKNFLEILKNTKDSKKLTEKQREKLFELIKTNPFIQFSCSSVGPKKIDQINIAKANQKVMENCLRKIISPKIKNKKILILIDGNQTLSSNLSFLKKNKIVQRAVIKGDEKIFSIALASVIAKVIRDKKMKNLSLKYPQYKFNLHKGYGTKLHQQLIKKYGSCKIHRKSFKL
ncbi:MAG: ribonuclease HII [Candidatus Pacebacteria bacterium]|nr:ribonuclease HII [Candidatus Paceibacterota bacterium]